MFGQNLVVPYEMPSGINRAVLALYNLRNINLGEPARRTALFHLPAFATPISSIHSTNEYIEGPLSNSPFWADCPFLPASEMPSFCVFILSSGSASYEIEIPSALLLEYTEARVSSSPTPVVVPWKDLCTRGAAIRPSLSQTSSGPDLRLRRFYRSAPDSYPRIMCADYHEARIARALRQEGVRVVGNTPRSRSEIYAMLSQDYVWPGESDSVAKLDRVGDENSLAVIDVCPIAPEALQPGEEGGNPRPRLIVWGPKSALSGDLRLAWVFDGSGATSITVTVCPMPPSKV